MPNKEEILEASKVDTEAYDVQKNYYDICDAMEIYANQEKGIQAIAFYQWMKKEGWLLEEDHSNLYRSLNYNSEHTIQELYKIFTTPIN